jgi:hypothetical protein
VGAPGTSGGRATAIGTMRTTMSHNLDLSQDEHDYLLDLLREERGRLKSEVHHTDARDYKDALRIRAGLLRGLIERLEAGETA